MGKGAKIALGFTLAIIAIVVFLVFYFKPKKSEVATTVTTATQATTTPAKVNPATTTQVTTTQATVTPATTTQATTTQVTTTDATPPVTATQVTTTQATTTQATVPPAPPAPPVQAATADPNDPCSTRTLTSAELDVLKVTPNPARPGTAKAVVLHAGTRLRVGAVKNCKNGTTDLYVMKNDVGTFVQNLPFPYANAADWAANDAKLKPVLQAAVQAQ